MKHADLEFFRVSVGFRYQGASRATVPRADSRNGIVP